MPTTTKVSSTEVQRVLNPANWELSKPTDRMFTSDHVVDAYMEGKSVGVDEERKILMKSLTENIDKAGDITKEVLTYLKDDVGFSPISAHLKINSISDFQVLVFIPTKEFLKEKIFSVYSKITETENKTATDFFKVHMSIGNTKSAINEGCLVSDGYSLHFKM